MVFIPLISITLLYILLSTLQTDMEPVNLGYSDKNIPIAKPREYLKCLIEKTESFLRRVRWKAYHFLHIMTIRNKFVVIKYMK